MRRTTHKRHAPLPLSTLPVLGVLRVVGSAEAPTDAAGDMHAAGDPRAGLRDDVALPGGTQVCAVTQPLTTIGRGLRNAIVLADPAVSRSHARLFSLSGHWWVENTAAHNPLWIGGREVYPGAREVMRPGETLRLGGTLLRLLAPPQPTCDGDDPASDDDTAWPADGSSPVSALEASGTHLLSPGVTLQFALKGRLGPRAGWALALAACLLFLVSAVITLGTAALVGESALASGGAGHVLAAVTIPLVPALGVALLVGGLDRYEREPVIMLLAAFAWGAVIAIPPALYVERGLSAALPRLLVGLGAQSGVGRALVQALNAGVTEEVVKGIGLVLLLLVLRDEFDNVTDGVLYGALIGAGFAMVENFVYFAVSPRADLGFLIFGRVVLGWLSHSTFTALFGAALGYVREHPHLWRRWLVPLLGLLAAIALHTLFDFVAFGADVASGLPALAGMAGLVAFVTLCADYLPLFGAQVALLRVVLASLRREAAIVREYLAGEVLSGAITPEEYLLAQDASRRAAAEHQYALAYGARAYLTARALFQTVTGLAFRAWHVAQGDPPKPTARQPEEAYRLRIARLRRSLARQVEHRDALAIPYASGRSTVPTRPIPG